MNSPITNSHDFYPKCLKAEIKSVANSADIRETDDRRLTMEIEIDMEMDMVSCDRTSPSRLVATDHLHLHLILGLSHAHLVVTHGHLVSHS